MFPTAGKTITHLVVAARVLLIFRAANVEFAGSLELSTQLYDVGPTSADILGLRSSFRVETGQHSKLNSGRQSTEMTDAYSCVRKS